MTRACVMVVIATFVAACGGREELRVAVLPLEQSADRLLAGQPVVLQTVDGLHVTVRPEQIVDIVGLDDHRFSIKLADVIRDCRPHAAEARQLCDLHGIRDVVVGTRRVHDRGIGSTGGYLLAGGAIVTTTGLAVCMAECGTPYNYVAAGVVVAAMVGLMYELLSTGLR